MFTIQELEHIATAARLALTAHSMQLTDDVLVNIAALTGKCGAHIAALKAKEVEAAEAALKKAGDDIQADAKPE